MNVNEINVSPMSGPAMTGDADRGQAAFTHTGLALYDLLVLRGLCPWVWRCPNERILAAYRQHLSNNHLEVGVGPATFWPTPDFRMRRRASRFST